MAKPPKSVTPEVTPEPEAPQPEARRIFTTSVEDAPAPVRRELSPKTLAEQAAGRELLKAFQPIEE